MRTSDTSGQQGRVLLVDDDPALGGYLTRVLRNGGFDVVHELDAHSGLFRVEAERWDLLSTDIELPGMSGLELLNRVRWARYCAGIHAEPFEAMRDHAGPEAPKQGGIDLAGKL